MQPYALRSFLIRPLISAWTCGLAWLITKNTAVFAEYRHTRVRPSFDDRPADLRTTVETDLNAHHLVGGISFRF